MAESMQLGVFAERFLRAQNLEGFDLTFEPVHGKRNRRAKRNTVVIKVEQPEKQPQIQGHFSAAELVTRFHRLAPETEIWTSPGANRYRICLRDYNGRLVDDSETIYALRNREVNERKEMREKAQRQLGATLKELDRQLDNDDIVALLKAALKERYGK